MRYPHLADVGLPEPGQQFVAGQAAAFSWAAKAFRVSGEGQLGAIWVLAVADRYGQAGRADLDVPHGTRGVWTGAGIVVRSA